MTVRRMHDDDSNEEVSSEYIGLQAAIHCSRIQMHSFVCSFVRAYVLCFWLPYLLEATLQLEQTVKRQIKKNRQTEN